MKRPGVALALLFAGVLLARLCHCGVLWVEEAYPAAAAIQILQGKALYRDFWFDKPPLSAWVYLLWGGYPGLPLRVAGALFVLACCLIAYRFARELWSGREGLAAAALLAVFLTFDFPAAVMALAPDQLMVLPHLAALYLAWRGRAFAAGAAAGAAVLANPKGLLVLAACLLWSWRRWYALLGGFAAISGAGLAVVAFEGGLRGYLDQVWIWGALYSRDTFVENPVLEGVRRTASWAWFHAAGVVGAGYFFARARDAGVRRWGLWCAIAFAGVVMGWRFFPRYYFVLLPPLAILAGRGLVLMPVRLRAVCAALLLIPAFRFGPGYARLGWDALRGRTPEWADVSMNRDSAEAASLVAGAAGAGDTLLVWGYRPDVFVYTRMPVGAPFLDSQPLTGVIADRHLTRADVSAQELAVRSRLELARRSPRFIVDGLGPFNPSLAIAAFPDLAVWLEGYETIGRTKGSVIYRRRAR